MTWTPIPIPEVRHPASTTYGFMLDRIWAGYAARRPHWPEDMFISVQPCVDLEAETEASGNVGAMTRWVFFDDGKNYTAPQDDLKASDWLIGELP